MRRAATILGLLVAVAVTGCRSGVRFAPGVVAAEAPRQTALQSKPVFLRDDYLVKAVARFEIDARVLGRERYRLSRGSGLSPVDLALGWGPMSDQSVIDQIKITQSRRFYWWRVKNYPIPRRAIIENSANMHMIPADDTVRDELLAVRKGELISISGYLVNVSNEDGFTWRTSTTRTDAGAGACEIVYVQEIRVSDGAL